VNPSSSRNVRRLNFCRFETLGSNFNVKLNQKTNIDLYSTNQNPILAYKRLSEGVSPNCVCIIFHRFYLDSECNLPANNKRCSPVVAHSVSAMLVETRHSRLHFQ